MPNGQSVSYGCDAVSGDLTGVSSAENGEVNANAFGYNKDYVTEVSHNGFDYGFKYDGRGNITGVSAGGDPLLAKEFTYGDGNNGYADTESVTYANGCTLKKEYDKYGRLTKQYEGGVVKAENVYDGNDAGGRLAQRLDSYAGLTYTMNYDGLITLIADMPAVARLGAIIFS